MREPSVENIFRRIKCLTIHLHHVMKMRAGRKAAASDQADDIAPLHALPFFDKGLGQMAVQCFNAESMVELDDVAELGIESHAGDAALGRSLNGRISRRSDVETVVPS